MRKLSIPLHCKACEIENRLIRFCVSPDKAGITLAEATAIINRHYNDSHRKMGQVRS